MQLQWSWVLNLKVGLKTLSLLSECVIINRWKDETIGLLSLRVPAFVARSPQRFKDNFYKERARAWPARQDELHNEAR